MSISAGHRDGLLQHFKLAHQTDQPHSRFRRSDVRRLDPGLLNDRIGAAVGSTFGFEFVK